MSDKVSGCKKVSATSTKKGCTKSFCPVAMPKSFLPSTWNFILGISGMIILCSVFVVQRDIFGTRRESQEGTAEFIQIPEESKDSTFLPTKYGECYFHSNNNRTSLLTIDNDFQSTTDSMTVYLKTTGTDWHTANIFICVEKVCFELSKKQRIGKLRWQLYAEPHESTGYLDCKMHSIFWYNYIREFRSFKYKPVTEPNSPFCEYYAYDGTFIRLNDVNEWSFGEGQKKVSLNNFLNYLLFNSGDGNRYRFDVNAIDEKVDEKVLRWTFQGGYLECKPIHEFLANRKQLRPWTLLGESDNPWGEILKK